jgi:membrane protein
MRTLGRRARALLHRTLLTTWRALREFVEDRGHRDAAQISFFAVLSAIPLALLLIGPFGALLGEGEVRERVIDTAFTSIPLAQEDDRARSRASRGTRWTARATSAPCPCCCCSAPPWASWARCATPSTWRGTSSAARRSCAARRWTSRSSRGHRHPAVLAVGHGDAAASALVDDEGDGGVVLAAALDVVGDVLPFLFIALVMLFLYRILPVDRPRVRDIWPGALVAAAGLLAVKGVLELYLEHLADFGALYGSLGRSSRSCSSSSRARTSSCSARSSPASGRACRARTRRWPGSSATAGPA